MVVKFRGWKVCECMAITLPLIEQDMIRKGIIKYSIDIYQASYNKGGVAASAGTHDGGGVLDTGQYSDAALACWRSWGVEMQHRTPAQGFSHHGHGVWKGCPHLSSGARYQASEWERGRNGLVSRGPITGPGPKGSSTPSWKQGVKNHVPKPPPPPKPPKGLLGMTAIAKTATSKGQKLTDNGSWQLVKIDDKGGFTLLTGPASLYIAVVCWSISDLAVGDVAQFRLVVQDDDVSPANKPTTTEYSYPVMETIGTSGSTFGQLVWANDIGGDKAKDVKRRLRLVCKPPQGKSMTITNVTSRVAH